MHMRSGRFLAVNLSSESLSNGKQRRYYTLEVENDSNTTDPYLEGGESTWFTILPVSEGNSIGENIAESDQVRIVSQRWQWDISFSAKNDDDDADNKDGDQHASRRVGGDEV